MRPLLLLLLLLPPAAAQTGPLDVLTGTAAAPDTLSADARVSLLTMLPGDEVYSLWGHSGFRIRDPQTGLDKAYNYGTFDFEQPGFLVRFLRGRLDYILDTAPFGREVQRYQYFGRPMIEQELALTPPARQALYDLLEENARPENRAYRYDIVWDNCSTRLLDMLDRAVAAGGMADRVTLFPPAEAATYRDLLDPYTAERPWIDLGTDLVMGLPTDGVASARDHAFLPLGLMEAADTATIRGRPLVSRRDTVFWVPGAGETLPAFPWPTVLAWALFLAAAAGTVAMRARGGAARLRRLGARLDGLLFFVAGTAGLVLFLMWVASDHRIAEANVELSWLWPTHLAAAAALARPALSRFWRRYATAAAMATAFVVVFWVGWPEPMHPALVPVALLLAARGALRGLAGPEAPPA